MQLKRGQKVDITKNKTVQMFRFHIKWQSKKEMEVDISAFLLDSGNQCVKDEHFIFYGQPQGVDGSVSHHSISHHEEAIDISFQKVPSYIEKIALASTIHEGDEQDLRLRDMEEATLFIKDTQTNEVLYEFPFKGQLDQETAVVIGELYRHNGEWKFNAVGSGFFGGLTALCENFGIQVDNEATQQEVPVPNSSVEEPPVPVPPAQLQQTDASQTGSSSVLLKKGQSIQVQKSSLMTATLEWINKKKELDFYCFYVLQTGEVGKVNARHLGSSSSAPYITLDIDRKTAGERQVVIHQPSKLKYVLFASYKPLSSGAYGYKKIKAKVVLDNQMGEQITASLYENNRYSYWAAIARIDFTKTNGLIITQVERYSRPGSEKTPVLYEDGSFQMDKGSIEFK